MYANRNTNRALGLYCSRPFGLQGSQYFLLTKRIEARALNSAGCATPQLEPKATDGDDCKRFPLTQ